MDRKLLVMEWVVERGLGLADLTWLGWLGLAWLGWLGLARLAWLGWLGLAKLGWTCSSQLSTVEFQGGQEIGIT